MPVHSELNAARKHCHYAIVRFNNGANLYACGNNPISGVDPMGLTPLVVLRPVDQNFSGKPTQTTAPTDVTSISAEGGHGDVYGPNNGPFMGDKLFIPNDIAPLAKGPLTELSACHSSEPANGYTTQNTSSAAILAIYSGSWTIGYQGTVWPTSGASFETLWFNIGINVPTMATLFDPHGNPIMNFPTPISPENWAKAQAYASSPLFK